MGRHRKTKVYVGKHRVVTPKRNMKAIRRVAIAFPVALAMALYPAAVGDGTGRFPLLENALPILRQSTADAGEVITEPPVDPPVVEQLSLP
jgi:hypothetical protein